MYENLGFFGTWLPGDLLELGDVGVLQNGQFRGRTTLKELKIPYQVSGPGPVQNLQYTSKSGTSLSIDSSVTAPQPFSASAAIKLEFNQEGAFLFHASKVRNRQLDNRLALAAAILRSFKANIWQQEWKLIESVHMAECATVVVSEDDSAALSFQANAKSALGAIPLADPQVNINVSSSRGRMFQVIAGQNLRPLYACIGVKASWLTDPVVEAVRGERQAELPFVRPSINELINS